MTQSGETQADGDVRLLKADPDAALQLLLAMPKARVRLHIKSRDSVYHHNKFGVHKVSMYVAQWSWTVDMRVDLSALLHLKHLRHALHVLSHGERTELCDSFSSWSRML